jgi:aminopeptidase-like protein
LIHETLRLTKEEFQPHGAFNCVAKLASFHRVQCSPGIRDAARYIHAYLKEQGIQTEILSLPAKHGVRWWSQESFPEWFCRDAELVLLEDGKRERLCAFSEQKTSLVQRSAPTPPEGITTTMVFVENGEDPKSYEGLDVKGKLVFSRGTAAEIAALAVDKFGAAGIVVDTMREQPPVRDRFDLPDGRQYLSFWPANAENHKAFGFVVSPRQGEALRRLFSSGKRELAVFARVDSEYFDGSLEIVSAIIPGETDEEVTAVAHLCHPEPSANDNASGAGALMEAVRTLSALIAKGSLPKPRRTIRFLWLPEMTGSYAFLASNEDVLRRTVAAINLDMVGENQALCGSTFMVERPVAALAGFGGDLAACILGLLTKEVDNLARNHSNSTFRYSVSPFSGGSDHNIWGDPSVGVTCPMLIQWPDKFYHTSEDTIDKVDPKMLAVAGTLTATYLYTAATATPADAAYIADQAAVGFAGEASAILSHITDKAREDISKAKGQDEVTTILAKTRRTIEKRVAFLSERRRADVASLVKLAPDSVMFCQARSAAQEHIAKTADYLWAKSLRELATVAGLKDVSELPAPWRPEEGEALKRASEIVPKRAFRGPYSGISRETSAEHKEKMKAFREKYKGASIPSAYLQYWADGNRTLSEIADLLEGETGFRNTEALIEYYELMAERGVYLAE